MLRCLWDFLGTAEVGQRPGGVPPCRAPGPVGRGGAGREVRSSAGDAGGGRAEKEEWILFGLRGKESFFFFFVLKERLT